MKRQACRLPLGMPSRLWQRALKLAEGLIRSPGSRCPDGQGTEREAGYIVLGALCASGLPKGQKVNALQAYTSLRKLVQLVKGVARNEIEVHQDAGLTWR